MDKKKAKWSKREVRIGSRWTKEGVYIYAYVPKGLLREEIYPQVPQCTLVDFELQWAAEAKVYKLRRARKLAKRKGGNQV